MTESQMFVYSGVLFLFSVAGGIPLARHSKANFWTMALPCLVTAVLFALIMIPPVIQSGGGMLQVLASIGLYGTGFLLFFGGPVGIGLWIGRGIFGIFKRRR